MAILQNLSPGQRQAVIFGGPVVAAFALITVLQKRNQPATTTPTTGGTGALLAPSTDAIGTGQLADFESTVTGAITQLANQIATWEPAEVETPAPTTTVIYQQVAAPAAAPTTTAAPAPSSVPLSFWQSQPWYGRQVDASDPTVPNWYKMGFMAPPGDQ